MKNTLKKSKPEEFIFVFNTEDVENKSILHNCIYPRFSFNRGRIYIDTKKQDMFCANCKKRFKIINA